MNDLPRPKWVIPAIITRAVHAAQQQRYGDAVHEIAHPIATVLDNTLGTALAQCGGCAERRERWNQNADSDKAAKEP
jgi:hypothetical protein